MPSSGSGRPPFVSISSAWACYSAIWVSSPSLKRSSSVVTDPDTGELAEQFTRNLLRLPRDTILSTWAPDPDVDITPVLAQVKAPTLVLHGTEDSRVPLSTAYYLAEHLPDAQLHLFEGVGHLPIFTATVEFCDVLRRFVRTGELGAAPSRGR
jgi:pimeloyl-ACP methyl ester carboxylesterase